MGPKTSLAQDNSNFRTSTLVRHLETEGHRLAIRAPAEKEGMDVAQGKALKKEDRAISVAMKAVFWLSHEGLPLSKYSSLINFLKELAVPDIDYLNVNEGCNYSSYTTAVDLLDAISTSIDNKITETIKKSPVLTVMTDESTDIMIHHKLCISARVVNPLTLAPKTLFLSDVRITSAKGKALFACIKEHLDTRGITTNKVNQLGTDGARVMTGHVEGLTGHFLRVNPHVLNNHCSAHRLALCAEQAANKVPAVTLFKDSLVSLFYYFKRSPDKIDKMEAIQKLLEDPVLKYR